MQFENDKKSMEFKKGMIQQIKIKNEKDAFVTKELRKKVVELNNASVEMAKEYPSGKL